MCRIKKVWVYGCVGDCKQKISHFVLKDHRRSVKCIDNYFGDDCDPYSDILGLWRPPFFHNRLINEFYIVTVHWLFRHSWIDSWEVLGVGWSNSVEWTIFENNLLNFWYLISQKESIFYSSFIDESFFFFFTPLY